MSVAVEIWLGSRRLLKITLL